MRIGVPKETKTHEYRVGLTPSSVAELTQRGHEVWVERGAGHEIGFVDADYRSAGARLVDTAAAFSAELVVKVNFPPDARGQDILQAANLRPTANPLVWDGAMHGGYERIAELEQQLEQAGVHASEIRVREPGLTGVFLQLTGQELEP